MSSSKIPLFNGLIYPLHNGDTTAEPAITPPKNLVFIPPDKNLDRANDPDNRLRRYYEVHLWIIPVDPRVDSADQLFTLEVFPTADPSDTTLVWGGQAADLMPDTDAAMPYKVLDGYMIRGDYGLQLSLDFQNGKGLDVYPFGAQAYGYVVLDGVGAEQSEARRFMGAPSPDGVAEGLPIAIASDDADTYPLHTFSQNRFDEVWIAAGRPATATDIAGFYIRQVDSNGVDIISGQRINISIPVIGPNAQHDPQSPYLLKGAVLGPCPNNPNLAQLLVGVLPGNDDEVALHGSFVRH